MRVLSVGRRSEPLGAKSKSTHPTDPPYRPSPGAADLRSRHPAQRDAPASRTDISSTSEWICTYCTQINPEDTITCQRCGRVSIGKKADILATEDVFLIDGMRALEAGDEELAHRWFVFSTEAHPHSEIAWYWRSRTSTSTRELVICLEHMLVLNPSNPRGQSALQLAKARLGQEERAQADARLAASTDVMEDNRHRLEPVSADKIVEMPRRIFIELASIPCFLLGLLWIGQPVVESLRPLEVRSLDVILPVLTLPTGVLDAVQHSLLRPLIRDSAHATSIVEWTLAFWFLVTAFRIAGDPLRSRALVFVNGLVGMGVLTFVSSHAELYSMLVISLLVLGIIGKGRAVTTST